MYGQVTEEAEQPLAEFYRHISKGAWPFSTRDHGWPISDCSSEGLKAALCLAKLPQHMVRREGATGRGSKGRGQGARGRGGKGHGRAQGRQRAGA